MGPKCPRAIIPAIFVLFLGVASAETSIYEDTIETSNKTQQVNAENITSINPVFTGDNISIRLSTSGKNYSKKSSGLTLFKRYKLEVSPSEASYISINFENDSINRFLEGAGAHPTHLRAMTFPNKKTLFFQRNESLNKIDRSYKLRVYPSKSTEFGIFAARSPDDLKKQKLAINPSRTRCGYYWNPNSSFQKVNGSCQGFRENQSEQSTGGTGINQIKIPSIGLIVGSILLAIVGYVVIRKTFESIILIIIKWKTDRILSQAQLREGEPSQKTVKQINEARKELENGNLMKAVRILGRLR